MAYHAELDEPLTSFSWADASEDPEEHPEYEDELPFDDGIPDEEDGLALDLETEEVDPADLQNAVRHELEAFVAELDSSGAELHDLFDSVEASKLEDCPRGTSRVPPWEENCIKLYKNQKKMIKNCDKILIPDVDATAMNVI